jgi:repressor LexA
LKRPKHNALLECLGTTISSRRERLGLTQSALAARSGVDRAFISSIESGKRNVSLSLLANLADGLNVSLVYLIGKSERCAREKLSGD